MRVDNPCPTCGGSGVEHRPRRVKVRVPAGVEDGQRIRVKGRGGAGRGGGPPGDLYVVVHTGSHPIFGRRGKDLTITAPVSFPEAALGATITVPTLDRPVSLKVPAGTRSGQVMRVRGRGVPAASGTGDLLVTVEVVVPSEVDDQQRQAIGALGDLVNGEALRRRRWGGALDGSTG